jgi:hypothetical protein
MADKTIIQEDKTRAVIEDEITQKFAASRAVAVTAPTAAGATYDETQAESVVVSVNEIIAALQAAGILA